MITANMTRMAILIIVMMTIAVAAMAVRTFLAGTALPTKAVHPDRTAALVVVVHPALSLEDKGYA